jgi:hypothetical protein
MPFISIVQAFATLAAGLVVGLVYVWKIGLVGLGTYRHSLFLLNAADYLTSACVPFLMSTGYIRLVGGSQFFLSSMNLIYSLPACCRSQRPT